MNTLTVSHDWTLEQEDLSTSVQTYSTGQIYTWRVGVQLCTGLVVKCIVQSCTPSVAKCIALNKCSLDHRLPLSESSVVECTVV